ncbi:transducin/WD40 repeat-like superfamily protein [Actinidia rufa]|uniref:Transducin/WD40 repeat-like superfamily protein n=1 Tax=Actinidia rufa TaxID=165716 RepID=A0A7J0F9T5_9ERIC|nr:transducin/WD40 repeat-like superfamily protein [Actinidia rufa]
MAEQTIERSSSEDEKKKKKKKKKDDVTDPEFFSCVLQPSPADSDPNYIGIRRLLLHRKAQSGVIRRKEWRCNGKGYVAFRNYINRPRNWESLHIPSHSSTPGHSGRWISSPSPASLLFEVDNWSPGRDLRSGSQALSHSASFSSNASDIGYPHKKAEPAYSFVGMHCIFDQCKAMDFDFSSSNQYIASSSMDKTVRIWEISKGLCIRVLYGVTSQLCIRFHPVNNNFLSVGNANREVTVFNFSTGRIINKITFDNEVTAMDHDHTGQLIFCGDAQGCVSTVSMDSRTGSLSRSHRNRNGGKRKSPVTTVQYRTFSLLARGPVLLAFTRDGSLSFFSVSLEVQGYLTLRCSLKLSPRLHSIRASFCPLLSLEKGEYIVVGSEDTNVYFYDLTRPKHPCVNKLQGHGYPAIGIAWNHGENLLASSDFGGTVIVWKRAKTGQDR